MGGAHTQHGLLFAPSVGPGYDDTRVRPWNAQAPQGRKGGYYYDNEWHVMGLVAPHTALMGDSLGSWGDSLGE